jgi:NAD(P)H-hydrate epimerase
MPELMTEPLEETKSGSIANVSIAPLLRGKTVCALGPGLGTDPETQAFVRRTFGECVVPVILDADGLNAFSEARGDLRGSDQRPVVITPHPGEMARLIDRDITFINENRIDVAREFASRQNVHVVLKGFRTVVATPNSEVFINATGNPGMATAGMGDILTGMLAGIVAQSELGAFYERVLFAVHLHGSAGDLAAVEIGEEPLIATDLLYYLGDAWEQIRE